MSNLEIDVPIQIVNEELIPKYASEEASGADVHAAIQAPIILAPKESRLIPTSIKVQIPKGYEIQVRPRSGLALKQQITVLNTPGTIDSDFRGEIGIILINHGMQPFEVLPKMRIAQLVLAPVVRAKFTITEKMIASNRGEGGFGHTGSHSE